MKVLVIGGTGFIGPHVVRRLVALGHEVTVCHRGRTEANLPDAVQHIRHQGGRGRSRDFLREHATTFRELAPDVVLDMIPCSEADGRAAVEVFRGIAGRLVAISSADVYRAYDRFRQADIGPLDEIPLTENSPLRDRLYPYREEMSGADPETARWAAEYEKILVERVVMAEPQLPGTVARLPAVYGPGDFQHRLYPYLKRMDDGRPAVLMGEGQARWRWSRGYVENVGAAIATVVADDRASGRIYNVAEPEAFSEEEWVRHVGRAADWQGEIVIVPDSRLPESLRQPVCWEQHWVIDSGRLRHELGYQEPVPLDEGLQRTITWERDHPPKEMDPAMFDYAAEDAVLTD